MPTSHSTIQDAVDDDGCTAICVRGGVYPERLTLDGLGAPFQPIVIEGAIDETVILDGEDAGSVISAAFSHLELRGLTLRGGSAVRGGGLYLQGSDALLEQVHIEENVASEGGAASTPPPPMWRCARSWSRPTS